jgi:hypothetical protein
MYRPESQPRGGCYCSRLVSHVLRAALPLVAGAATLGLLWPDEANAQIKSPGAHPHYSVELEPHGILQWAMEPYWADEGFGLGMRATIPFFHNGPIKKINNNMGIGFGLDVAFSTDCDDRWYYRNWRDWNWALSGWDCSTQDWMFPVVMQWNFFFTDIVSVAGEVGLTISYERIHAEGPCNEPDGWCEGSDSDVDVEPNFWGGGRFLFGETIGLFARIGTPYISVGATFLL